MKILTLLFLLIATTSFADELPGEFSGEATLESRFFPDTGAHANTKQVDVSLALKPEYSYSWDQDRKVVTIIPYARISQLDDSKTHVDIRELSFVGGWEKVELRAGVSKVFWGVTESQHLVDVINQTDFVENPDGEDKLGQPLINATYVSDYGNFDFFLLPYFRERTFAGNDGRLRGPIVIDTDNPIYTDPDEEKQLDYAARWSHYIDSFDWGLSYFKGVDRDPGFVPNSNGTELNPLYGQNEQFGLELQYVYGDWLFKGELLKKDSQINGDYLASVLGFEYTFTNLYKGIDIGVLYEWIYDERGKSAQSGLNNASFAGTRIALNDESSTDFLLGGIADHESGGLTSIRLETTRRINQNWKWELEGNIIVKPQPTSFLNQLRRDDYIQFSLSFYL
jgi:hypothetical protein